MGSFLGIDVGTKRIKAIVLDEENGITNRSSIDIYDLTERPQPSWAQRDVNELWKRLKKILLKLGEVSELKAICLDATSGTIVPVDKKGKPTYPALMYSDERAVKEANELKERSSGALEFERFLPIAPYLALPKIMWLRKNTDFKKVCKVLHESDFLVFKLTGEMVTSPNVASKSHAAMEGNRYMSGIFEDVDVSLDLMPPIKQVGDVIGSVTQEASKETGLPAGTPVVNGMTDASSSDLATGTLQPGQASTNIGTTLTLHTVVKEPAPDPKCRFYYKPYFARTYLAGGATNAGTLPLDAICRLLEKSLLQLEEMAQKIPRGCDGLLAQPEWTGIRIPRSYPNARGFFINVTERNWTPGHLYRSILEGNAFVLAGLLDIVEEVTETDVYEIRTCGGGAKSHLQNEIISNVTGKIVRKVKEEDAALGSSIIAIHSICRDLPISGVVSRIVKVENTYEPDLVATRKYARAVENLERFREIIGEELRGF